MNSHQRWVRQLREAQKGLPNEYQAARTIALNAALCAVLVGLLANIPFIGIADPMGLFPWIFIATAIVCAFGAAYLVLGVYYKFGFRPVAKLADAVLSTHWSVIFTAGLTLFSPVLFAMIPDLPLVFLLCPLFSIPIGTFAISLFRILIETARDRKAEAQAVESHTAEHTEV